MAKNSKPERVTLDDFLAHLPNHTYIFTPTGAFWNMTGVNACLPAVPVSDAKGTPVLITKGDKKGEPKTIPATVFLDRKKPTHHLTWAPGHPMKIEDQLVVDGAWLERKGVVTFNFYRPPTMEWGDADKAKRWLDHVRKVYPNDHRHIVPYLAHRVQHPEEKINHGLVLGGAPGIGKDTILEPVKRAIGPWNFKEASPQQILGRFNGYLKAVILRVSEVRDLGDFNRYQFYEHMKAYLASPPDVLRLDEKHTPEYDAMNCVAIIFTTNHLTDGIYLPGDDRRHYVAWSELTKDDFDTDYWNKLWGWYESGGYKHVAAYLAKLELANFDAKAPPEKTPAFWTIVDANCAPEEGELADILDKLGNPDAVTISDIQEKAQDSGASDLSAWLQERKNRRIIPHRLEKVGYVAARNDTAKDGLWKINGARQVVYGKSALSVRDRFKAVEALRDKMEAEAKAKEEAKAEKAAATGRKVIKFPKE